jgi:TDG/mug DNA glycosylase family protein
VIAVVGITAYRTAFDRKKAVMGEQPDLIADSGLWVLPNPSGLNAHYQLPALGDAFAELRSALDRERASEPVEEHTDPR